MIGDVIRNLRTGSSMTQTELGQRMGVIKQTISNWEKNISTPSIDAIVKLSSIFNVPTDYLLESGVFSNWDLLLANKMEVLEVISSCSTRISKNLLNGTDDITFAKLVYAFNIQIQNRDDGVGISAKDPIPTYANNAIQKHPVMNNSSQDILQYYNQLTNIDKVWIMGQIVDLIKGYEKPHSSVAADDQRKVVGK